jgi:predicted transcriptional regulator
MSDRHAFLLITDEKYWGRLRQCKKESNKICSFVRKNVVGPKETKKVLFYIKKPAMQIRGFADFVERVTGKREEMWISYGAESCFKSLDEYNEFTQGREKVTFVRFQNFVELKDPKQSDEMCLILGSLQGVRGKYVDSKTTNCLIT